MKLLLLTQRWHTSVILFYDIIVVLSSNHYVYCNRIYFDQAHRSCRCPVSQADWLAISSLFLSPLLTSLLGATHLSGETMKTQACQVCQAELFLTHSAPQISLHPTAISHVDCSLLQLRNLPRAQAQLFPSSGPCGPSDLELMWGFPFVPCFYIGAPGTWFGLTP